MCVALLQSRSEICCNNDMRHQRISSPGSWNKWPAVSSSATVEAKRSQSQSNVMAYPCLQAMSKKKPYEGYQPRQSRRPVAPASNRTHFGKSVSPRQPGGTWSILDSSTLSEFSRRLRCLMASHALWSLRLMGGFGQVWFLR